MNNLHAKTTPRLLLLFLLLSSREASGLRPPCSRLAEAAEDQSEFVTGNDIDIDWRLIINEYFIFHTQDSFSVLTVIPCLCQHFS